MMDKWSLSADMWTAVENGVCHYTQNMLKLDPATMHAEPPYPFGTTFYTPINRFKVVFRSQSQLWWDNFLKGSLKEE
jgi:hypothetical protein